MAPMSDQSIVAAARNQPLFERIVSGGATWLIAAILIPMLFCSNAFAEFTHAIVIDGNFSDWANVRSYQDPVGGPRATHHGIPDTHDTDHSGPGDTPVYVNHPDIDLVEYKFTHDSSNLYAYFRATGKIGNTSSNATVSSQQGRYYVIVTLDVDDNLTTGYPLHEGGYYPTSGGYDMNMEVEFFNGTFNTGHYLNHGATNQAQLNAAFQDQTNGVVRVLPGTYKYYSQWVWFDTPTGGSTRLPSPDDYASITFVEDKGPVYQGIIQIALSPDKHEAEMVAPFRGFMRDPLGNPILALGKTISISISLEASQQLAPPPSNSWASDTGDPIVGYYLSPYSTPHLNLVRSSSGDGVVASWASGAIGMILQRATGLTNPDWQAVLGSDSTNRVTLSAGIGAEFFRLVEPF